MFYLKDLKRISVYNIFGVIVNNINNIHRYHIYNGILLEISQIRHYAARRGTREKAKKRKVKVELKKLNYTEKIELSRKIVEVKPDILLYPQKHKLIAEDNVFFTKYYQWKIYPFAEAIQCHREYFHPTVFNAPESLLNIFVELDMQGAKKTKSLESFNKIVPVQYQFHKREERRILVFCKTEEEVKLMVKGGAALAGGKNIVKLIVNGEISIHNYDTIIAHPSMMPEILPIRGLLKKNFPSIKAGTLGINLQSMLQTQLYGIKYTASPHLKFSNYGFTNITIGTLNMDTEHLEDNLKKSIESILSAKPNRSGSFITRIRVECPPSSEKFQIDHSLYINEATVHDKNKFLNEESEGDVAIEVTV